MPYATVDDMTQRFGAKEIIDLTDLVNFPPSVIGVDKVNTALIDAQNVIDGYVGQVYRLPLRGCLKPATVPGGVPTYVPPPQLLQLSCDMARYYLYKDVSPQSEVSIRFNQALKALGIIAAGTATLACPWGGEPGDLVAASAQTEDEVLFSFSKRQITDESTRGY